MNFKITKYLLVLIVLSNCKSDRTTNVVSFKNDNKSIIKYAKNLEITTFENYQKVSVKNPINQSEITYFLVDIDSEIPDQLKNQKIIRTPIANIVATSTTHIAMLELLGVEKSLIGFPQTNFISSEKTRNRIDSGYVAELGNVQQLNTEIILTIKPDLIMSFEISGTNKTLQELENKGFSILVNNDWLEETPLGRAEWLLLFGALYQKNKEAKKIYHQIEANYLEAQQIALKAKKTTTALSGIVFNDVWNLPAGKSFEAQLLKDANINYLWKNNDGTGSLLLSIEVVLDKAKNADVWINPGIYNSVNDLQLSNNLYNHFNALKNKNVFSYAHLRGKTGGYIYFETAPTRPDLVLKDLIKIAHPELMRHYDFTFYKKLE
jgi:iron complex transport system substrate-binding protein